jgi:hypothetical protein
MLREALQKMSSTKPRAINRGEITSEQPFERLRTLYRMSPNGAHGEVADTETK